MDERALMVVGVVAVVAAVILFPIARNVSLNNDLAHCMSLPNDDLADHPAYNRGHPPSRAMCISDVAVEYMDSTICEQIEFEDGRSITTENTREMCKRRVGLLNWALNSLGMSHYEGKYEKQ